MKTFTYLAGSNLVLIKGSYIFSCFNCMPSDYLAEYPDNVMIIPFKASQLGINFEVGKF